MIVFWQHGYEGSSIADLTNAMGFTPPTLYAAFGSKEQLYAEALAHYLERGEQDRAQTLSDATTAYTAIEQYLRGAADRFTDPSTPAGCMISTASLYCASENEAARTAAAALRANTFVLLVSKLEWAQVTGELPPACDTQALARFYSAVVQGMSVQAIDGASSEMLNGLVEIAMSAWPGKRPAA
jgi:TetR/AcrR family transcriptional regulator, copper-responsive repressor